MIPEVGRITSIILGFLFFPFEPLLFVIRWEWTPYRALIIGTVILGTVLLVVIIWGIWQLRKLQPTHQKMELIGQIGTVTKTLEPIGLVRVQGEIWQAQSQDKQKVMEGSMVRILEKIGLVLLVEPVDDFLDLKDWRK